MTDRILSGRSMFIWRLGPVVKAEIDVAGMVRKAKHANLSSVWIKIADGLHAFENVAGSQLQTFKAVRSAMRDAGIEVWGWHVPYGGSVENAREEAKVCAKLACDLNLDGVLMDAEGGSGYFTGGKPAATAYASTLRASLVADGMGIAMCGNDIPNNFSDYPFASFVEHADSNAPQVYYGGSPSVLNRLTRAIDANKSVRAPFIPVGAAWVGDGGGCASASACAERAREFIRLAGERGFQGYGFWHWMGAPAAFWEVMFELPA
jgi:hypothetical protein